MGVSLECYASLEKIRSFLVYEGCGVLYEVVGFPEYVAKKCAFGVYNAVCCQMKAAERGVGA